MDHRYPVNDGTILNSSGLAFTPGVGYTASVPLIIGVNRDEGGILAPYPGNKNMTAAISGLSGNLGGNTSVIYTSGVFLPAGTTGNETFQVLNVTSRIVTDANMRCDSQAVAYAGAKNKVFPAVYAYQFNRTYQSKGYSNFACNAPPTATKPLGDPDQEYLKCHSGEITFVTGSLNRWQQDRDGNDTPFAQLMVDYWGSFARTGNPNPDKEFLKARGYQGTLDQIGRSGGAWKPVSAENPQLRWLQWGPGEKMADFQDKAQCEALGLPYNVYDPQKR